MTLLRMAHRIRVHSSLKLRWKERSAFYARLPEIEKQRNARDIRQFLGKLRLPKAVEWVTDLEFEEWNIDAGDESLELAASTKQGYLTMFAVDDSR